MTRRPSVPAGVQASACVAGVQASACVAGVQASACVAGVQASACVAGVQASACFESHNTPTPTTTQAKAWTPTTLALLLFACFVSPANASNPEPLDWSSWERMPMFHDGRMMPLKTYAQLVVKQVVGRTRPTLSLTAAEMSDQQHPSGWQATETMFGDDESRRFSAEELVFAWIVQPDPWENVPFLPVAHEELRRDILELPIHADDGSRLKYVSPAQVEASGRFWRLSDKIQNKQRTGAELGRLDEKAEALAEALALFRLLSRPPADDQVARGQFVRKMAETMRTWREMSADVGPITQLTQQADLAEAISVAETAIGKLPALAHQEAFDRPEAESVVVALVDATATLADRFRAFHDRLLNEPPKEMSDAQLDMIGRKLHAMAWRSGVLARQARELHLAVFDHPNSLRLVPAVSAAALEKDRDESVDAQPWLGLRAVLEGSDRLLEDYPAEAVGDVRGAFGRAVEAYGDRTSSDRPERFALAMADFSTNTRQLGERINALRADLTLDKPDEALLAATAYPEPGSVDVELYYCRVNPFLWSWILSLVSLTTLALAFGWLRKPFFWLGVFLLGATQGMIIFGFTLRVLSTGWAPVTNMFETVVFVALVVGLLGIGFATAPLLFPGLGAAWRFGAVPWTPEASRLTPQQEALAERGTWDLAGLLLLVPRLALIAGVVYLLTMVPYGSGEGYTIFPLWPRTDVGTDVASTSKWLTWGAGMGVLVLTAWFVPRLILATVGGVFTIPWTLRKSGLAEPVAATYRRRAFVLAGAAICCLASIGAYYLPISGRDISPLMPVLRDNFWLTVHVLTITAAYGGGALAWGMGLASLGIFLFGRYEDRPPQACAVLGQYIYKTTQVAVILLALGTILGAIWADNAWGRFWGWDSKEVWALISLLVYIAILHGRYAGFLGDFALAAGSVVGATAIIMAWYGVNFVFPSEKHGYADGTGGFAYVSIIVAANWLFAMIAGVRHAAEKRNSS